MSERTLGRHHIVVWTGRVSRCAFYGLVLIGGLSVLAVSTGGLGVLQCRACTNYGNNNYHNIDFYLCASMFSYSILKYVIMKIITVCDIDTQPHSNLFYTF